MKFILASASSQRKKLLNMAGFQCSVKPANVWERHRIKTTVADLVKENAFLKAQDVASRLNAGIVIGADTIVYSKKGGIIGKPRDLKDARRILKILASHPSWVYTGVALIDAAGKKKLVDCEKTKIFMDPLTEQEMRRYHLRTSPLDKAGGFDIEGRGGLFIRRIEGCYTNVIGLPLAKLRGMLKKFGVEIL